MAAGRLALFVRLMGCNLSCSWCDTPYTWRPDHDLRGETTQMSAVDIASRLIALAAGRRRPAVVISGGEPLLQQRRAAFVRLLELVGNGHHAAGYRRSLGLGWPVHLETNGTIAPQPFLLHGCEVIAVSPKLGHAGPHRGRQNPTLNPRWCEVLRDDIYPGVHLKVVVRGADDVAALAALVDHQWQVPRHRVWVMPEGTTAAALGYRWPEVSEAAVHWGFHATHRLHVLAWGDERGR